MAPMAWCSKRHNAAWGVGGVVIATLVWAGVLAAAPESNFHIAAQVDKTKVDLGSPVNLSITLEGDLQKTTVQPFEFPQGFSVVAQSRATNVAIQAGQMKRSVSLNFVLLAREAGTFKLGPFQVLYDGKPVLTDPIEIVVSKPVLPPGSEEHQRYTL